jgi:hypothetical protein
MEVARFPNTLSRSVKCDCDEGGNETATRFTQ